jgi:hypothetical protein
MFKLIAPPLIVVLLALSGPAEAYKLHNGNGLTTSPPTTVKGTSSQTPPFGFSFPGYCDVQHHHRHPSDPALNQNLPRCAAF